jgi:transcriptional regulator with XRE-family HTH domain
MPDPERLRYNRELGERIAVARKGAAKSEREIAEYLGVPINSYLRWERGERQFPMHLVLKFCQLTGFAPGFIVTGRVNGEWQAENDTGIFAPRRPAASDDDDDEE